jgi:hypothetical protein
MDIDKCRTQLCSQLACLCEAQPDQLAPPSTSPLGQNRHRGEWMRHLVRGTLEDGDRHLCFRK